MILGVNGIRLVRNRSGVARAIEAVLNRFATLPQPFDDIRVYTPEPLDADVKLPAIARNVVVRSGLPPSLWEQVSLPAAHGKRHVLFCPSYVIPLFAACPTMLVHHGSYEGYDRRHEVFGWWARTKARIAYDLSARRATVVSTVSEYSRRDMQRFYGVPAERIHVIPEGVDTDLFRPILDESALAAWRRRVLGEDVPFLLYVGKPTKRRNLPNLLRAFHQLKRDKHLPHKLLLIGTALPGTSFQQLVEELALAKEVVTIPHAAHDEIALAYNACSVTLYPSSYEGFGMPVLEAMACGAPVITLNNTAFPEFAGGVARLLPDAEVGTLVRGIEGVLGDAQGRREMRVLGPQRASQYDWRIIAQRYLDLLIPLAQDAVHGRA
jgi:glycosyltransferase involved in cell wall biosynthesis